MDFRLTNDQLHRLANICEDIAKAFIISSIISPAISNTIDLLQSLQGFLVGLIFIFFCISIEKRKE